MAHNNAAQLFKAVKQDQALQAKIKAAADPETFLQVAKASGYDLTTEELQNALSGLSEEDLAAMVNPGVGPRHHIHPR